MAGAFDLRRIRCGTHSLRALFAERMRRLDTPRSIERFKLNCGRRPNGRRQFCFKNAHEAFGEPGIQFAPFGLHSQRFEHGNIARGGIVWGGDVRSGGVWSSSAIRIRRGWLDRLLGVANLFRKPRHDG